MDGDLMNTSQTAKLDKLLNYGIKKNDQEPKAHLKNVEYIEPGHMLMVRTSNGVEEAPIYAFDGIDEVEELNTKCFDMTRDYPIAAFNRKALIAILEAMDSDIVTVRMNADCPILIEGRMGKEEIKVEAICAPRIYDDCIAFYD